MTGMINPMADAGFLSPLEALATAAPSVSRSGGAHAHHHPAHFTAGQNQMRRPPSTLSQRDARRLSASMRSKIPSQEQEASSEAEMLPENLGDLCDPGRHEREERFDPANARQSGAHALDRQTLENTRARTLERLADVADAYAKAKDVGADIAAKGAHRTLLKKCLGVALAVVAVGLLAAVTGGTALVVVAAVKAALCVGDAVYARRVWKHHQAVASGDAQLIARYPLPKKGASLVGNLAYDFAKAVDAHDEAADRFASVVQVLVAAGLLVAGLGCAGLPTEFLPRAEDALEIADKVDDGLKMLLYGEQAMGAAVHAHHRAQQDALRDLHDSLRELQVHLDNEVPVPGGVPAQERFQLARALGVDVTFHPSGNDNDLRTYMQAFAESSGEPALSGANFSKEDLREVLDLLDSARRQGHEHHSHGPADLFAYLANSAGYGVFALT